MKDGILAELNLFEKLSNKIEKRCDEVLLILAEEVFDKNPSLNAFSQIFYTPGFNDGAPCQFTIGNVKASFHAGSDTIQSDDDNDYDAYCAANNITIKELDAYFINLDMTAWDSKISLLSTFLQDKYNDSILTFHRGKDTFNVESYDCGY